MNSNQTVNLNVAQDPFLIVMDMSGNSYEVSVKDALVNASNIEGIHGECFAQDISIYRFLLGILHRVFQNFNAEGKYEELHTGDQAIERWISLWKQGFFPAEPIEEYLKKYKDRFNLIDPKYPFMQVHESENIIEFKARNGKIAKGDGVNPRTISKLVGTVFASESRPKTWSDRYFGRESSLSLSEATRWLIFINCYDDASFKKPSTDIHVGYCGQMTGIYAFGRTLFETLMLNLPLCRSDTSLWKPNVPYWENETPFGRSEVIISPAPDNPSALLTFPSRRMNLKINQIGRVVGYDVTGHHSFSTDNYFIEQNAPYRKPDPKKSQLAAFTFQKLSSDWLWQNYGDLFLDTDDTVKRPGVVEWISLVLNYNDDLEIPYCCFRSITVKYKSMQCVFSEMTDDMLIMNSYLLSEEAKVWRGLVSDRVSLLIKCACQTGIFFKNLSIAGGGDPNATFPAREGEEKFWNKIDPLFRDWLESIDELSDFGEKDKEMDQIIQDVCLDIVRDRNSRADLKTALGRTITDKKITYNLQKSISIYLSKIKKILETDD